MGAAQDALQQWLRDNPGADSSWAPEEIREPAFYESLQDQQGSSAAPPQPAPESQHVGQVENNERVQTCKGSMTVEFLIGQLEGAGYGGPWTVSEMVAAFNRAACPSSPAPAPAPAPAPTPLPAPAPVPISAPAPASPGAQLVQTCKGAMAVDVLTAQLQAAGYPGPWAVSDMIAAFNRAACPGLPSGGGTSPAPGTGAPGTGGPGAAYPIGALSGEIQPVEAGAGLGTDFMAKLSGWITAHPLPATMGALLAGAILFGGSGKRRW